MFSFVQDIQDRVQEYTPEIVITHHCGPGFENYPQASEHKVTTGNGNSFPLNEKLLTNMLEHNEVCLQPVIGVSNTENVIQCVLPEILTCANHHWSWV